MDGHMHRPSLIIEKVGFLMLFVTNRSLDLYNNQII